MPGWRLATTIRIPSRFYQLYQGRTGGRVCDNIGPGGQSNVEIDDRPCNLMFDGNRGRVWLLAPVSFASASALSGLCATPNAHRRQLSWHA